MVKSLENKDLQNRSNGFIFSYAVLAILLLLTIGVTYSSYLNAPGWALWIFLAGMLFSFLLFIGIYRDAVVRMHLQRTAAELLDLQNQQEHLFEEEKKSRVAAEQANIAKDEFIAVISHELKTPLNAIAGWTRILRANEISEETHETAVAKIEKNLRQQTSLIEQIIAYSDLMSQGTDISGRTANIGRIFDESAEEILPAAMEKKIEFEVENNLNGHVIEGDEEKLRIVLVNLLSNAVKFTESGGKVDAKAFEEADSVRIVISDNGAGISSEFLPQIFEHYRQADRPNIRGYGGLGLGLAISKQLVQIHNGTIDATSEGKGKGSVFTVSFPYLNGGPHTH